MVGVGRSPGRLGVLGVTSVDPVLSLMSAFSLGQTAGSALVIDLCRDLTLHGGRTLSDLAVEGPSLAELSPGRSGVALLASGPIGVEETRSVIEALAVNWPAVVVRCHPGQWAGPTVPVRPLFPGLLQSVEQSPAVWQPLAAGVRPSGPGPVLPRLRGSLVRRMLSGRSAHRARWVRAWAPVWGMPWA
jgi:hypothetical protein